MSCLCSTLSGASAWKTQMARGWGHLEASSLRCHLGWSDLQAGLSGGFDQRPSRVFLTWPGLLTARWWLGMQRGCFRERASFPYNLLTPMAFSAPLLTSRSQRPPRLSHVGIRRHLRWDAGQRMCGHLNSVPLPAINIFFKLLPKTLNLYDRLFCWLHCFSAKIEENKNLTNNRAKYYFS